MRLPRHRLAAPAWNGSYSWPRTKPEPGFELYRALLPLHSHEYIGRHHPSYPFIKNGMIRYVRSTY